MKIAAIGKLLRLQPITDEEERQQMIESGNRAEIVAAHVSIYAPCGAPATCLMVALSASCCERRGTMRAGYSAQYGCSLGAHPTFQR